MVKYKFLSQNQIDFLERQKSLKQLKKEEKEFEEAKKSKLRKFIERKPQQNFPVTRQRINFIQRLDPAPALSKEQDMLQELFNGERTFGTGNNLPNTDNKILRSGGGIINCGDEGATGEMFGLRRNSYGFNGEGGY